MNIYLIRHGDSEKSYVAVSDFERKLTPEGISQLKKATAGWKKIIPSFDYIISSPLVRAKETAKIVADVFDFKGEIILDERIASGGTTEDLINTASELKGTKITGKKKEIAFVGHEPDFSNHISNLTSNSGAFIDFKKGTIAKISFNGKIRLSKGVLEFLIPPKVFQE